MFVLYKPFQLILLFVSNAGAYPSEAPFMCSTQGSHKNETRLQKA